MEITNTMILTAITDLSGFVKVLTEDVKTLTEDMVEVKSDIAGMKEDISGMKEEISGMKKDMQRMDEKIDNTYKLAKRIDNKLSILNEDLIQTRVDVLELQRAK